MTKMNHPVGYVPGPYGAQEDPRMATPESGDVEWIGYDAANIEAKVLCKAKTWFEARAKIASLLNIACLGDVKVERKSK